MAIFNCQIAPYVFLRKKVIVIVHHVSNRKQTRLIVSPGRVDQCQLRRVAGHEDLLETHALIVLIALRSGVPADAVAIEDGLGNVEIVPLWWIRHGSG